VLAQLAEQAQTGEDLARSDLCVRSRSLVERYFRGVLGSRDDVEDATQHVLARMLNALPSYQTQQVPFEAWLLTIARNHMIDRSRSRVRTEAADPWRIKELQETDEPRSGPARSEQEDSIMTLIAPLPRDQQRVIVLIYVHDLTNAQVGEILGKPTPSVRQLHKRARDILREIIEAQSGG
jgi:RNA polymerase sigma-70 factor (ECF subfamily)